MEIRQRMIEHINGGESFSELHYRVTADGEDTEITHHVRTNGWPTYEVEADELRCGDESFDVLSANNNEEVMDWIRRRAWRVDDSK